MEEMVHEVSKSVRAKPWLLAAAGLAIGLLCFSMVAGARLLSHVMPAPGEPAAGEQAAAGFEAFLLPQVDHDQVRDMGGPQLVAFFGGSSLDYLDLPEFKRVVSRIQLRRAGKR